MRVRIGKDIKIKWAVLTDGSALPLNKEELTLELVGPNGKSQSMEFEAEGNVLTTTFYGKDQNYTGDYMLTLWKNKGKEGQSVVDKTSAFSLVRYTPQEDHTQKYDNLNATLTDLGDTSLVTIYGPKPVALVCNLTGYKAVEDVSDLPMEPSTIGYLVGDNLYVYVGEGGDVRLGAYKNCGPFRGLKGDTGTQGPQGNSGYQGAAGELQVVNNLTEGGEAAALSAEQGKVLDGKKQDNLQTYHESGDYTETSIGVRNVILAQASCSDNTRSSLLLVDKDETDDPEQRVARLAVEKDGEGAFSSHVGAYGDKVQIGAPNVIINATGGRKAATFEATVNADDNTSCVALSLSHTPDGQTDPVIDSKVEISDEAISMETVYTDPDYLNSARITMDSTTNELDVYAGNEKNNSCIDIDGGTMVLNATDSLQIGAGPSGGDNTGVHIEKGIVRVQTADGVTEIVANDEEGILLSGKKISMTSGEKTVKDVVRTILGHTDDIQKLQDDTEDLQSKKQDKFATIKEIGGVTTIQTYHIDTNGNGHDELIEVGSEDNCVHIKSYSEDSDSTSSIKVSADTGVTVLSPNGEIEDIVKAIQDNTNAVSILNGTLDDLEKADASLREEIANIKDKDAEQDEEITSLLNILEGKLDIKDLGSGLRPDQAVSEIIQYVRSNEIKSALVFKYIATDNSSTFGICISRTGTSGWIIYLVARKGLEVLKFNSHGSRETWNEYGGVLRHDMNSVADEQLECLSIKGIKSVLATKQDALISGQNIRTINGKDILGGGNIEIETGITEEEKAEINAKIEGKADIADVEGLAQELADKAPKSGYAPDLKVNFAKELVGRGEATEEVIGGIRPTGVRSIGDGNATIEKIKGNSVVWNQLVNHSHWTSTTNNGITFTVEDDGEKIVVNGTSTGPARIMVNPYFGLKANHKYALTGAPNNANGTTLRYFGTALRDEGDGCVINVTTDAYNALAIEVTEGLTVNNAIFYPKLTDLTLMFGAGNEPTTIEDFEARKPLNVTNEYNEGTIVSYDGDALKSVGFNAWDEKWEGGIYDVATGRKVNKEGRVRTTNLIKVVNNTTYHLSNKYWMGVLFYDKNRNYISYKDSTARTFTTPNDCAYIASYTEEGYGATYKNDVCINLSHSEYRNGEYEPYVDDVHPLPNVTSILDAEGNQLFPNGLLSAGNVHDEITATKAVKRVGVVDMGTLSYQYRIVENDFLSNVFAPNPKYIGETLCAIYGNSKAVNIHEQSDKAIRITHTYKIVVKDSSYTSTADFKAAMSGVLLYYELATPIEVDLPEPLNMTYVAWDFGTEELVAEGATTPLNADIVYQFNAVDRIRENTTKNADLEARIAQLVETIKQLTAQTTNEGGASNEQPM